MSKKERVKTKLGLLKVLIIAVLTALFSVMGYVGIHYKKLDLVIAINSSAAIIALILIITYLLHLFGKELDKLEKL